MKLDILPASDPYVLDSLLYPELSSNSKEWIRDRFYQGTENLTDVGRRLYSTAEDFFKRATDGSIERSIRGMYRSLKGIHRPNVIYSIDTLEECRLAKPIMQRYIMAEPTLREIYHRQMCDGYSDSYVDIWPTLKGQDHPDYRKVMSGAVQLIDEKGNTDKGWRVTMYADDLDEGDRMLEPDEQFVCRSAWDVVRDAIEQKIDPTNIFGGELEI